MSQECTVRSSQGSNNALWRYSGSSSTTSTYIVMSLAPETHGIEVVFSYLWPEHIHSWWGGYVWAGPAYPRNLTRQMWLMLGPDPGHIPNGTLFPICYTASAACHIGHRVPFGKQILWEKRTARWTLSTDCMNKKKSLMGPPSKICCTKLPS